MPAGDDFSALASPKEIGPDWFPELGNLSGRFLYRFLPVPDGEPVPPEYVYVPYPDDNFRFSDRTSLRLVNTISSWNWAWEAGRFKRQMHDARRFPRTLRWLLKAEGRNIRLVPDGPNHKYDAYAPVYHLLPRAVLERHGLPLLKRGLWPYSMSHHWKNREIPSRFEERLSRAFSQHVWRLLSPGNPSSAFSRSEPIVTLSHNLDFWLPYIDVVAQRRIRALGRTKPENGEDVRLMAQINARNPDAGGKVVPPSFGGTIWRGEDEAWEATQELVAAADENGRLSALIDAVRSHRVQEDFSSRWSYAREDFERKLYHKRLKIKVKFVELRDTIAVHGRSSETDENLVWEDFLTLLNPKEKSVAVCLRNSATTLGNVAKQLAYANHSPVSKALAKIRKKARSYFGIN